MSKKRSFTKQEIRDMLDISPGPERPRRPMAKFIHNGLYMMYFQHFQGSAAGTRCVLSSSTSTQMFVGDVYLFAGDIFDRNKGRKAALKKALKNAGLPREARTAAWEAYFAAHGKVN